MGLFAWRSVTYLCAGAAVVLCTASVPDAHGANRINCRNLFFANKLGIFLVVGGKVSWNGFGAGAGLGGCFASNTAQDSAPNSDDADMNLSPKLRRRRCPGIIQ